MYIIIIAYKYKIARLNRYYNHYYHHHYDDVSKFYVFLNIDYIIIIHTLKVHVE